MVIFRIMPAGCPIKPGFAGGAEVRGKVQYNFDFRELFQETVLAENNEKLFKAEYLGSGTFVISKPKRKKTKMRQTALRNPRRGSRK
jgi:hypothetical protein